MRGFWSVFFPKSRCLHMFYSIRKFFCVFLMYMQIEFFRESSRSLFCHDVLDSDRFLVICVCKMCTWFWCSRPSQGYFLHMRSSIFPSAGKDLCKADFTSLLRIFLTQKEACLSLLKRPVELNFHHLTSFQNGAEIWLM